MSGIGEVVGVIACVAAIVSAYNDGGQIFQRLKEKRAARHKSPPTILLEESLEQSPHDIEQEKNRGLSRLGAHVFDRGDEIAISALREVKIQIKAALFDSLVEALQNDDMTDLTVVLDAADGGRDRTIKTLIELRQRLMQAAPLLLSMSYPSSQHHTSPSVPLSPRNERRLSPSPSPRVPSAAYGVHPGQYTSPWTAPALELAAGETIVSRKVYEPAMLPNSITSASLATGVPVKQGNREEEYSPSYFPQFFSFKKFGKLRSKSSSTTTRPTVPAASRTLEQSLIPDSWDTHRPDSLTNRRHTAAAALSRTSEDSHSNPQAALLYGDFEDTAQVWGSVYPENVEGSSPLSSLPSMFTKQYSFDLPIPTEENNFLGFCKGAWKLQSGSSSAFKQRLEFNSGWSQSKVPYLACSSNKCAFAGRLPPEKINFVWRSSKGVNFRWRFLAKSHVPQVKVEKEQYAYLCMFCALMGHETCIYAGVETLMAHLSEHRGDMLPPEVLHRSRCVSDRVAGDQENFDINLLPRGMDRQRKASTVLSDSLQTAEPGSWRENTDSMFNAEDVWR